MSMDQNRIDALGRMIVETARKQEMTAAAQTPRTCPNCGAFPVEEGKLERELAAVRGQLEDVTKQLHESDKDAIDLRKNAERAKSALAAAKEGIAALMIKHGMATGHGDTCDDLLRLLDGELAAVRGRLATSEELGAGLLRANAENKLRAERAESALDAAKAEADALRDDAERWLMLFAFAEKYQLPMLRIINDVDAEIAARKGG